MWLGGKHSRYFGIGIVTSQLCCLQLYLSEQSLDVAITTAKSSEINLVLPGKGDADPVELPVPEQFVSTIQNGRLVTEPVSHGGG